MCLDTFIRKWLITLAACELLLFLSTVGHCYCLSKLKRRWQKTAHFAKKWRLIWRRKKHRRSLIHFLILNFLIELHDSERERETLLIKHFETFATIKPHYSQLSEAKFFYGIKPATINSFSKPLDHLSDQPTIKGCPLRERGKEWKVRENKETLI